VDQEEQLLVERAKVDPDAFGVLYDRHLAGVYRYVYARLHNAAAAEDVTAEVFIKALRNIGRYQARGRPFACWLYRIAANAVADHFRHEPESRELPEGLPDREAQVETSAIRHLEVDDIWRLVARLPRQQRLAMRLRFGEDRSLKESAQIMGKSEPAVKLLIYRAVGRLRLETAHHARAPMPSALAVS
jgi:RNA polymerase sigma-70 factor (ECF subfamily)